MTKYIVAITKVEPVIRQRREYKIIADSGNKEDGGAIYDYVPYDEESAEKTEIYQQEVENLNITDVINAVNGQHKQ